MDTATILVNEIVAILEMGPHATSEWQHALWSAFSFKFDDEDETAAIALLKRNPDSQSLRDKLIDIVRNRFSNQPNLEWRFHELLRNQRRTGSESQAAHISGSHNTTVVAGKENNIIIGAILGFFEGLPRKNRIQMIISLLKIIALLVLPVLSFGEGNARAWELVSATIDLVRLMDAWSWFWIKLSIVQTMGSIGNANVFIGFWFVAGIVPNIILFNSFRSFIKSVKKTKVEVFYFWEILLVCLTALAVLFGGLIISMLGLGFYVVLVLSLLGYVLTNLDRD